VGAASAADVKREMLDLLEQETSHGGNVPIARLGGDLQRR
jgi:hypothetical protein